MCIVQCACEMNTVESISFQHRKNVENVMVFTILLFETTISFDFKNMRFTQDGDAYGITYSV